MRTAARDRGSSSPHAGREPQAGDIYKSVSFLLREKK
jgi:hypothetical protein